MLNQEKGNSNGERTAIGIDPCKEFLQLAILSHQNKKTEFKKLPLLPSITAEIAKSTDPKTTQIAIESYGSYGKLYVFELLKKGYDIREINPEISKKLTNLFKEEHSDRGDAESFAKALHLMPNLPKISFTEEKLWLAKLTRSRKKMVKDLNSYLNRFHIALTESYGAVYKGLFRTLSSKKALKFFEAFPTINDTSSHRRKIAQLIGNEKWESLKQAGRWEDGFYLETLRIEIRGLIKIIRAIIETKKMIEARLKKIGEGDEEIQILRTFPGIDYITASILLGEIGDIKRFESESCLSAYCGVSPILWQSGTSKIKFKRRKRYSRRLKGILYFISLSQMRINPESRNYYWRKRKEGKTHWQAMNALSRQLIKIIYYMLKNKEAYYRKQLIH